MATSNNQTNKMIKWLVIFADFFILNILVLLFIKFHYLIESWSWEMKWVFLFCSNLALLISEMGFSTIVHRRVVSAGDIVRRVLGLVLLQMVVAYMLLKGMNVHLPAGKIMLMFAPPFFALLMFSRLFERLFVKRLRKMGANIRYILFVGNDPELINVYEKLISDSTMGYHVMGYYADAEMGEWTHSLTSPEKDFSYDAVPTENHLKDIKRLGSIAELIEVLQRQELKTDELYVSLSRRDRTILKQISQLCDQNLIRFYYVPVSVETIGINLKRELLDDIEVYTTYENPLSNPVNKMLKRLFDIVMSLIFILITLPFIPIIALIIKIQSPKGKVFFKQYRTGIDGKKFNCYKFRSMHPNKDEDGLVQATKDDPRKFPFGNFMRKANIDELPQFWNVLKGDMSIVGPRPHPVALNEMYAELIKKYMVRHFVKPGVTGWAQVTGFRGETKELWQMEGRVKRDIWYMEHWSIWLDIRIIWLTIKSMVIHDKNAY